MEGFVHVEIRLFGELSVTAGSLLLGPRGFGGRKPKQVLEILALNHGQVVSKDRLAQLLWDDDAPRDYEGCLEHYVSLLRRRLRGNARTQAPIVLTGHRGYRLADEPVWLDIAAFEELDRRSNDGIERSLIEQALAVARGELLQDEPYAPWALEARHRYRHRQRELATRAAELAVADGDLDAAVGWARIATGIDPMDEASHRMLMIAHYARGERTQALQVFSGLARVLRDDAGVAPTAATTILHTAILNESLIDKLAPERGRAVVNVVEHATQQPMQHPLLPFLGRQSQLAALRAACMPPDEARDGGYSLLVVEGGTGTGKTRLLDEFAADRSPGDVVRLRCAPGMRQLPGVLVDDLGQSLARQADAFAATRTRESVARPDRAVDLIALRELERALDRAEPFTVLVDDAHWADEMSLRLLSYLAGRPARARVSIVLMFNEEELEADHRRLQLAARHRHWLGPLTEAELRPLGIAGLHAATGGLPIAVAAYLAPDPVAAQTLLEAYQVSVFTRIRSAGGRAWRVAVGCAVSEPPCTPESVAELLHLDVRDVAETQDELITLGVLEPATDGYGFRYPAVQQLLRETVSPARLSLLAQRRWPSSEPARRTPHDAHPRSAAPARSNGTNLFPATLVSAESPCPPRDLAGRPTQRRSERDR
jgi:DNA-binding SARP family transcriptional activator